MSLTPHEIRNGLHPIYHGDPVVDVLYRVSRLSNTEREDFTAFLNTPHETHRTTTNVSINGQEVEDEDARLHVENAIKPVDVTYDGDRLRVFLHEVMVSEMGFNICNESLTLRTRQ